MNKYQLYKLLRKHEDLKVKRHPMFDKNRFMKFLMIFMWLYYAAILIFMGVTMAIGMKGAYNGVAAFHVLDGWFPIVLIIDFWIRFVMQDTPVNQAKPYTLLPIRRSFLMHVYLIRSGFSLGNLYWGFMLVPFGLIAIAIPFGWIKFAGWLFGWWLLCIANGFCYLFVRTLLAKHMAWLVLPVLVHGAVIAAMVLPEHNWLDMPCTALLNSFANWNILSILAVFAVIAFFVAKKGYKNIKKEEAEKKAKQKAEDERRAKKQEEIDKRHEEYKKQLIDKFGPITRIISNNLYNLDFIKHYDDIFVFEKPKKIIIDKKELDFCDILSCSLYDENRKDVPPTQVTRTNTGSMLGRAAVGGLTLGLAGAVVGAMTAKTESTSNDDTSYISSYVVKIGIKSIEKPTMILKYGSDKAKAEEVYALMQAIIAMK